MASVNNVSSTDRKPFSTLAPQATVWSFDPSNKDRLSQLPDVLIKQIFSSLEIAELPALATSHLLSKMVRTEVADRITKFIKNGTSLFPNAEKTPTFTEFETALRAGLKDSYENAQKPLCIILLFEKFLKIPQNKNPDDCLTIPNLSSIISEIINEKIEQTKAIRSDYERSRSLQRIVQILIAVVKLKNAEEVANTITREPFKSGTLRYIVQSLVAIKDFEKAIKVANTIPDERDKTFALSDIVSAHVKAKNLKKAEEVGNTITREPFKSGTLRYIVQSLVAIKDFEKAIKVANTIPDERDKSFALLCIVRGYIQTGDLSKAIEVANTIPKQYVKSQALKDIVMSLAVAGDLEEVEEVADMIDDEYVKSGALKTNSHISWNSFFLFFYQLFNQKM